MVSDAVPSRARIRRRVRIQAEDLKLVQFWLPDTNSAEFKAEARRQSRLIARSAYDAEDQAFVDAVAEFSADSAAKPARDLNPRKIG